MKRISATVSGKVQGVFYRDFARREAEKAGLTGYVRNARDGSVEIVAEGEDVSLKKFVAACKKGPLMAFVKSVELKESAATNEFEVFEVRY
jgi:acylphosphatase